MTAFLLFLLVLHITLCAACLVFNRAGFLRFDRVLLVFLLLVPVFGAAILVLREITERQEERKRRELDPSRPRLHRIYNKIRMEEDDYPDVVPVAESETLNSHTQQRSMVRAVVDDVNRMVQMDEDTDSENVIPLTEALRINSADEKRALMMDILYADPGDYVSQLTEASTNEDSEVAHYAVTALVELQKKYDLQLQRAMRDLREHPGSRSALLHYQSVLEQYIASGILSESQREVQLRRLDELLRQRIEAGEEVHSLYLKKTNVDLLLENAEELEKDAQALIRLWPDAEGGYLFLIRSYAMKKDREGIGAVVEQLKNSRIHLSDEGKQILEFWDEPVTITG